MFLLSQFVWGMASILLGVLLCSILEWFVHGPLMHGKLGPVFWFDKSHRDHHAFYSPEEGYSNDHHGTSVAIPVKYLLMLWALMCFIGALLGSVIGYIPLILYIALVSIIYFTFYQYLHTSMHIPKWRLLEKTRWFHRKNAYHKVHHLVERDFSEPVNICVVCSWADRLFGTYFRRK